MAEFLSRPAPALSQFDRSHLGGRDRVTLRQLVPALVTMVVLASGLAAIEATRAGAWDFALRFVLLAVVADGIDGPLARRLGVAGPMGKQLDSLSDIIAFGVAPAFLFATFYSGMFDPLRYAVAFIFVAAGVYRLARFHSQPGNGNFHGLPITAAGALLAVTVAGPFTAEGLIAGGAAIALALLMVGRHPFPKFSQWRWTLLPAIVAAAVPILLWPGVDTLAIVAGVFFGLYVLWSFIRGFVGRKEQEIDDEQEADSVTTQS